MDVGGGCDDDIEEEMDDIEEVSNFPVHELENLVGIALQHHDLQSLQSKRRLSYSDGWILCSGSSSPEDAPHIHPVDIEWHIQQLVSSVREIIGGAGAGGAGVDV